MSPEFPWVPSPADLARARPRSALPRESQPQRPGARQAGGRRAAEIEEERARRALRALVADPATDFAALGADEFSAVLRSAREGGVPNVRGRRRSLARLRGQPARPDAEFATGVTGGNLSPRLVYLLLFEADPGGWAAYRDAAWRALTASPAAAPGVLSLYTQSRELPPASYAEPDAGTAVAFLVTPDGPVVGEPAVAASQKAARAAAALTLVRDLAPSAGQPPGHDGEAGDAGPAGNPVGALNKRAQAGVITGLSYTQSAAGPVHRPLFTCVATCTYAARACACEAEGGSKNEAKAAAAAGLLDQVVAMEAATAAVAQVRAQRALPLGDLVMTRGTITDHGAGLRVRLGPDGRWYSFTHARGEWWPAVGAAPSAGAAYQAARRARSLRRA